MPKTRDFSPLPHLRIAVWQITETEEELATQLTLTDAELSLVNSFKSGQRRRQWYAVRALLYELLQKRFQISYHTSGKPFLLDEDSHLAITHCQDAVAIALDRKQSTGIDLQHIAPKLLRIKERFLNPIERKCFDESTVSLDYLHVIWCAKEALYKIHGDSHIIFKEHLSIDPFDATMPENMISGTISDGQRHEQYDLRYEKSDERMLVYVLN